MNRQFGGTGITARASGIAADYRVDVMIPGCPPRPEAIIHGLLMAVGRMPTFQSADEVLETI